MYLDHAATTPLDVRVLEEMLPYLKEHYGNASSVHRLGRKARFAIEDARERIAAHLGVTPGEIVFTSGGTEANNLALKGQAAPVGTLITSLVEHEAILKQAHTLMQAGWVVDLLKPGIGGRIEKNDVLKRLGEDVKLVSLMHVNNETGALNPITDLGRELHNKSVIFHCDAVQSLGHYDWDLSKVHVNLLTGSAHKLYGPKGVGFLYVKAGTSLSTLIEGGAQERKRRGGTENVAAIVGMAKAFDLAASERLERELHLRHLKQKLLNGLRNVLQPGTYVVNSEEGEDISAPHIVNIAFLPIDNEPLDGEMLLLNFDMEGICVSSGSACTSGAIEPSHVLLALGLSEQAASAAVRFSIGKDNTTADIEYTIDRMEEIVVRMRGAFYE